MGDTIDIVAPMQGTIVTIDVTDGQQVRKGQQLMLIESMKMHHPIEATADGTVARVLVAAGTTVMEGAPVLQLQPGAVVFAAVESTASEDPARVRPDLAEAMARHEVGLDHARPDAVARRRKVGRRTARENVADLLAHELRME